MRVSAAPPLPLPLPGPRLVDLAILRLSDGRHGARLPIPPALLSPLTLPGRFPLPPALRRLLAWDTGWLMRELGWFDAPDRPNFPALPFPELVAAHLGPGLVTRALPGLALPLCVRKSSIDFLHLLRPNARGEYPVLRAVFAGRQRVARHLDGFDEWLAVRAQLISVQEARRLR
jgi:hypothetical protein